jgi:hypothetical protein
MSDVFSPATCNADHFQLFCQLPYDGRAREIDRSCGHCGTSDLSGDKLNAELSQNFQKTNLCSPSDAPLLVTGADLANLQGQVDALPGFRYGNPHAGGFGPPTDRGPLTHMKGVDGKNLQEGVVVRFVGFMAEEHYSPASTSDTGESVNCGANDHPNVDIHIALVDHAERLPKKATAAEKDAILCPSVTAEMIPQFRPDDWEFAQLELISDRQVRVTGQLFFDGSHKPCGPHHGSSDPRRIASWEIHPIYAFEVCKRDGAACNPTLDSDWQSITDALKALGSDIDEQ